MLLGSHSVETSDMNISVGDFPPGIYFLQLMIREGNYFTQKFAIVR